MSNCLVSICSMHYSEESHLQQVVPLSVASHSGLVRLHGLGMGVELVTLLSCLWRPLLDLVVLSSDQKSRVLE
ncbi:unnamed protein product [Urochloa humidicola]